MSELPDKTRVIRLIKKPQQPASDAPVGSPPSEPPPVASVNRPRREDRPRPQQKRAPWKKKQIPQRREPRGPSAPPQPKPAPIILTEEQRTKVLDLYRGMVVAGERPPEGRRKTIAAMLNIPYANVAEVVRNYITHERYRRTNFDIEKSYWQAIRAGETNARAIARQIAARLNLEEGRIWWWLEKLHEPRKSFAKDPEVEEEKRAQILAEYETYLQQPDPPEKGLHETLAERIGGLMPRQVHKVLWEHRMSVWKSLEGTEGAPAPESVTPPPTG